MSSRRSLTEIAHHVLLVLMQQSLVLQKCRKRLLLRRAGQKLVDRRGAKLVLLRRTY